MRPSPQLIRFFTVAAAGLVVDLAVAWWLIVSFRASDPAAATVGLLAGMIFNYFCHLKWTFREASGAASVSQFLRFCTTVLLTLLIRLVVLEVLEVLSLQHLLHPVVRLFIGASVAFVFSYLLCRRLFFGANTAVNGGGK